MVRKSKQKPPKYRKYILPTAIILAIILIGSVVVALNNRSTPKTGTSNPPATTTTNTSSNSTPYSTTPLNSSVNSSNDSRKSTSSTSSTLNNPSPSSSFSVTITHVDTVDDPIIVGSLINGVTSGSCQLTASRSGYTDVTTTSTVVQQNNSYSCQSLSLAKSQFPASGTWNLVLSVDSGGQTASSDPWAITL
jgi:hypothetical protein